MRWVIGTGSVLLILAIAIWATNHLIVGPEPEPVPERPDSEYVAQIERGHLSINRFQTYEDLQENGWLARRDLPRFHLELPIDWEMDPFDDTNWQAQLHFWSFLAPVLDQYFRTADPKYLLDTIPYMLDWWQAAEEGNIGRFGWHDMATGLRAFYIGLALDRIYAGELEVSDETLMTMNAMADAHAVKLQERDFISMTNHGMFQVFGLRLLCDVASYRPACDGAGRFAAEMFAELLTHQYTEQGVHMEHSPDYHSFFINRVQRFGGPEVFESGDPELFARLERAHEVRPWLTLPDRSILPVGDSVGGGPLADRLDGEHFCDDAGRCYVLGDFSESGYLIVRSGPEKPEPDDASMLFMTGMAYGTSHKHVDDLSFVLYEDRLIFTDGGKYGYDLDEFRRYVRSDAAHNTIGLTDGRIGHRDTEPYGSALDAPRIEEGEVIFSGYVSGRGGLFDHARVIRYRPRRSLIIEDTVSADEVLPFASRLLLAHDLDAEQIDERSISIIDGDKEIARVELRAEGCEINTYRGVKQPRVLGWEAVGYQEMVPATVIEAECPGDDLSIKWQTMLSPK